MKWFAHRAILLLRAFFILLVFSIGIVILGVYYFLRFFVPKLDKVHFLEPTAVMADVDNLEFGFLGDVLVSDTLGVP